LDLDIETRLSEIFLALAPSCRLRASIAADRFEQAKLRAAEESLAGSPPIARRNFLQRRRGARQTAAMWDQARSGRRCCKPNRALVSANRVP